MIPVIALVGRPNVGKSTLFNRLTRSRDAIVDDQPGVTRDRLYGRGKLGTSNHLVVDTGGLEAERDRFSDLIRQQVEEVLEEADHVLFLVDMNDGLVPQDREIANQLRQRMQSVTLVVNKADGVDEAMATAEFQELALGEPVAISAKRGDGVSALIESVLPDVEEVDDVDDSEMRFVLAGRPNVGKSTLANKLVGEYRVIVSDTPGTTRDSVRIPLLYDGENITLIDTAGVRRRSRVDEVLEKFSVIKTLQAIEDSHVVGLVLDASAEIGSQDATIAGMVKGLGKSIVVIVNKWDRLDSHQRKKIRNELEIKLPFLPDPEIIHISALHGSRISEVMPAALRGFRSAMISLGTASLNRTLAAATARSAPPMHHQRPVRLKFAHQSGKNPPVVVVHGNQAESIPDAYRRYLSRFFSRHYKLVGTPLKVIPRNGKNPFEAKTADKKNSKTSLSKHKKKRAGKRH
ncbi:MAG: ribosome biogenesis GTPase Der [Pseudomonadota bacterium]